MDKAQEEIWRWLQEMNSKWAEEGRAEGLAEYFHETMVAITPAATDRIEGGKNCVAGWKGFTKAAKIRSWKAYEPKIQVYGGGKFAVATYYFDMEFEMGGREISIVKGRDMFCLVKEGGKWMAVADQYSNP
jgi:hypothetical protein